MKNLIVISIIFLINFNVKSQEEYKSIVTPYFNKTINLDSNLIYCSTFQIAWNELKDIIGDNIILEKNTPMVDSLNNGENAKKYVNKNDYIVSSGIATTQYINKLNDELKKKFKKEFSPITEQASTDKLLIYSFLYKNLKFKKEFEKIKKDMYFYNIKYEDVIVKSFGINSYNQKSRKHQKIINQTHIYINKAREFAVVIDTKNNNDQLIISTINVNDSMSLNDAFYNIMNLLNERKIELHNRSSLKIPIIDFDILKSYTELVNKTIENSDNKWTIGEAKQSIKFELNQKGAVVKSKAKIKITRGVSMNHDISFNNPFFIILKEKNSNYPYLMIWVANSYIMKKVN